MHYSTNFVQASPAPLYKHPLHLNTTTIHYTRLQ